MQKMLDYLTDTKNPVGPKIAAVGIVLMIIYLIIAQ
jgi:hypothetical protein